MVAKLENEDDIAKMRTAGQLAAEVLEMIGEHVQPGISTEALAQWLDSTGTTMSNELSTPNHGLANLEKKTS